MAFEPRTVTLDDTNPEVEAMPRRFWVSVMLTAPHSGFMVSELLPGDPLRSRDSGEPSDWIELALAAPVVLWGGWPFFERGWASLVNWHLNMFTLIALGVGAAFA